MVVVVVVVVVVVDVRYFTCVFRHAITPSPVGQSVIECVAVTVAC